jgi:hypothetical protein
MANVIKSQLRNKIIKSKVEDMVVMSKEGKIQGKKRLDKQFKAPKSVCAKK